MEDIFLRLNRLVLFARTGDYGNAASELNGCIQDIQRLLLQLRPSQEKLAPLLYSLETMLLMQQQKDWVAFADVIEYEFSLLLKKLLEQQGYKV